MNDLTTIIINFAYAQSACAKFVTIAVKLYQRHVFVKVWILK